MTTDQPPTPDQPPMPDFPPPAPEAPPAPAPRPRLSNAVIIGSAAAVIAAVVITGIVVVQATGKDDSTPAAAASSSAPAQAAADDSEEEPEPSYTDLDTDSFTIDLKTKSRQCFGSAGCNITVEPDLSLTVDTDSIDPDAVYEITYEIRGDESGPVIETAELSDQTSLNYRPSMISTASAGVKVSAKITDVSVQG
ncbi:hypothetical protein ACIPEL_36285 [Streptomyces griseoviridis]